MPRVSILTTTFNRKNFLMACLESALTQTFSDYELIVVDDGSTDGSWNIIQQYESISSRVRAFRFNQNQGRNKAITFAQQQANGELSIWLDSDDMLPDASLEDLTNAYDSVSDKLVYAWFICLGPKGYTNKHNRRKHGAIVQNELTLAHQHKAFHPRLYDTQLALDNWIDPTLKAALDYDLCMKLNDHTPFAFLDKPLYVYRGYGEDRMSADGKNRRIQQRDAKKAQEDCLKRRGLFHKYAITDGNALVKRPQKS